MNHRKFWIAIAGIVILVAATCGCVVYALQFRFGGYDLSPLIDCGWRVLSGQVPNRDFICTFPPILYLATAAGFRVFGVEWLALSLISALFSFVVTILGIRTLLLLRSKLGDATTLRLSGVYAALQMIPLLVVGHPWHSSWTQALALYALTATYAIATVPEADSRIRAELLVHLSVAATLLLLAKPNTALPALVTCGVVLLLASRAWWQPILVLAVAVASASLLLALVHTNLHSVYHVYGLLSSRLRPHYLGGIIVKPNVDVAIPALIVYIPLVWPLLATLKNIASDPERRSPLWLKILALGACGVSILGFGTNTEFRIVDVPCLLLGAMLLGDRPGSTKRSLPFGLVPALASLLLLDVFYAATRTRMQAVGEWGLDSCGLPIEMRPDHFFGEFHGCDAFFNVLVETDSALQQYPSQRVFFGPRMEFLYAREGLTSPKALPLWWHPGTSYPIQQQPGIVEAWRRDNFDTLIFLHGDRTRLPASLLDVIARDYVTVSEFPASATPDAHVDVLRRRTTPLP